MRKSTGLVKRRVTRRAQEPERSWQTDSHENISSVREDLARELLCVCVSALEAFGLDRTRLTDLSQEAVNGSRATPATDLALRDIYWLGELVTEWGESSAYLDGEGHPKVIPISGSGTSLTSLVRKYYGDQPVELILKLGCQTQVMERIGKDKVARLNSCIMFTGNPLLILAHSTRSIRRFLRSAGFNAGAANTSAQAWPEQTAFNTVPEADFPEFIQVMRQQMAGVLEMCNRWLTSRATIRRRLGSEKKVTMGIQAFVFRE
jgi:hypothetical protein